MDRLEKRIVSAEEEASLDREPDDGSESVFVKELKAKGVVTLGGKALAR